MAQWCKNNGGLRGRKRRSIMVNKKRNSLNNVKKGLKKERESLTCNTSILLIIR
jgi:hypothetical protein